ncbi:hypothetical protein [Cellulomonas biazotea]|jgi:hypothetical protein|uniref:Uncharacterized protein n=1 Tax=Cellulomonas biazotea TaxID=1709 RepID=A0A402DTS6_9CELL|nr:hypothetical protein [Cellulomonas biazotea]GCE77549.1 hypothetical protein CBZ_26050 [Cellulomonas biazotea]
MTDARFLMGFETDPDADALTFVDGAEILADPTRFADLLAAGDAGFEPGAVVVSSGGVTTHVEDTLRYLVLGLCLRAVPSLVRGEEFVYRFFDGSAPDLRLTPDGGDVVLSGPTVASLTAPRLELARSLHACGVAYLRFLAALAEGEADAPALVAAEAEARAALDAAS